jgi:predicted MPP superfamily phosphohydrolase
MRFALGFATAIAVYISLNYYVFSRGRWVLPEESNLASLCKWTFIGLSLSYLLGRILQGVALNPLSTALVWIGAMWFAALLHFFLAALLIDLCRLLRWAVPFLSASPVAPRTAQGIAAAVITVVVAVLALGQLNSRSLVVRRLSLTVPLQPEEQRLANRTLHVAVASDIHLGTLVSNDKLKRTVAAINLLQPDLVLLVGDVVDEDLGPVLKRDLGATLKTLRPPLGVFAVTGNHEYIGGVEKACQYLTDHGVTVLRDTVVEVGGVALVGREDRSALRFMKLERKPLADLVRDLDRRLPLIVMDHQPFELEEAADLGVALQLSGHTHHGQLWPVNFITGAIYELDWGYLKKGDTHFYISCGAGTWGPPVRTSSRPEIVSIRLRFE